MLNDVKSTTIRNQRYQSWDLNRTKIGPIFWQPLKMKEILPFNSKLHHGESISEWRQTTNWANDGDLIQFQFDQVLSQRSGHFSPSKSTRWSRNSEILREMLGRISFSPSSHFWLDEYLCSSWENRNIAIPTLTSPKFSCFNFSKQEGTAEYVSSTTGFK